MDFLLSWLWWDTNVFTLPVYCVITLIIDVTFCVYAFIEDRKHGHLYPDPMDVLAILAMISCFWWLIIIMLFLRVILESYLIIPVSASIMLYFFHNLDNLWPWAVYFLVVALILISSAHHRANWEATGDDVFPYRRKGPF